VLDTADSQISSLPMYFGANDPFPLKGRAIAVLIERVVQRDRNR